MPTPSFSSSDIDRLIREHNDGQWNEVLALYCVIAPSPLGRRAIEQLIAHENADSITEILGEAGHLGEIPPRASRATCKSNTKASEETKKGEVKAMSGERIISPAFENGTDE